MTSEVENILTVVGLCNLKRSHRRTLAISVLPSGEVEITAPVGSSSDAIKVRIAKRAGWIARQRRYFSSLRVQQPKRRYSSGATHRYLGRQCMLKVIERRGQTKVKLKGNILQIETSVNSSDQVERLVTKWMRERAIQEFAHRLEKWHSWFAKNRLKLPRLIVRRMAKRWGSAQPTGLIYLNPELIRAPSACIDYVIVHEICHLKYSNHGKDFYAELEKLCPGWKQLKRKLETAEL